LAQAVQQGIAGVEARQAAMRGYEGLIRVVEWDEQGRLVVPDICIGTSAGDYDHYAARPKVKNDLHGVGAFVMACTQMNTFLSRMENQADVHV
ncbi:MAG: glycoside hydrolase family 88 protein, partial [Paenibacillaceae bacterium]|nr:glycoside hydrolase family 88 protein [Paenibacillaceae bacterium]